MPSPFDIRQPRASTPQGFEATGSFPDLLDEVVRVEGGVGLPHVLNLYAADDDEPYGRWVNHPARDVPTLPLRQTQWFDLAGFVLDRSSLAALSFRMIPIDPERWRNDPTLSSGVGRQLTRRLRKRARIYQCYPPLVFHGSEESQMNPSARAERALDNRDLRRRRVQPSS